jgi:choline monooxygenase
MGADDCRGSDTIAAIRAELAEVRRRPVSEARCLTPAFYTSDEFLKIEREELFIRDWVCVGHVSEVANPGDFFTFIIADEPLLVTRATDGQVRVLSNVCRHRANLVAHGRGNAKRFVCGYHAWAYACDGANLAAPLMEKSAAFDKSQCGLPSFRTELWQDFIFVNLSGTQGPLAPRLEAFLPSIRNYHGEGRHHQFTEHGQWKVNWKCLVENFMEGYHLSVAHAKTLHPVTPTKLCTKMDAPIGMTAYRSGYDPTWPERGPYPADLTAEERRSSVLFSVFPNLLVALIPNVTLYMIVNPHDVSTVDVKWGLSGTVADPQHPDVIAYRDLCFAFNAEDKTQLEDVQQGLQSRFYRGGPLAPADFEGTIWDFYQYIAARLGGVTHGDPIRR